MMGQYYQQRRDSIRRSADESARNCFPPKGLGPLIQPRPTAPAAHLSYAPSNASIGDPMAKLSMHEDLPVDEAVAPPRVSTGDLPLTSEIRRLVTEAYERYRSNDSGKVADYIPVLAEASPDLFGIAVVGAWGRSFEIGDVEVRFSIQSVSKPFVFALVCDTLGYEEARVRLGVNSTGFPF